MSTNARTRGRIGWAPAAAVVVAAMTAAAAWVDRTWLGGSGSWEDPDAWVPAGIPGISATDVATIPSGTVTMGSAHTIARLDLGQATLDATADLTVSGTAELADGTLSGSADLVSGALVLEGALVTEDADDCCNIVSTSTLELRGPGTNAIERTLVNQGAGTWTGGDLDLTGGKLVNEAGATFTVQNASDVSVTGGVFENAGSWIHQGIPPQSMFVEADFLNTGTIDIESGVMQVEPQGTLTQDAAGATTVAQGATLRFAGGSHTLAGSVGGAGLVEVLGGTLTVPAGASYAPATTRVVGGTLSLGAGSSPGLTTLEVAGGTFVTAGDLSVDEGRIKAGIVEIDSCCTMVSTSTLELSGPDPKRLDGTLVNQGAGTWTGGDLDLTGGKLVNEAGATFTVQNTSDVDVTGGVFENAGTWIHDADSCCTMRIPIFENTGTVDVQSGVMEAQMTQDVGGATTVAEGATLAGQITLDGGTLSGGGTLEGQVTNGATVDPGELIASGAPPQNLLRIDGDYEQTAAGTLRVRVGAEDGTAAANQPFTPHARLEVSGAATLNGTLELAVRPDAGLAAGDELEVLTWGQRTGQFAALTGTDLAGPLVLEASYETSGLSLRVVATEGPAAVAASGAGAPAAQTSADAGARGVSMLEASLGVGAGGDHGLLRSVTLVASGTGDDAGHVTEVALLHDVDGDGAADAGEPTLATGAYGADDGELTLTLAPPLRIEAGTDADLLVAYDLATSVAAAAVVVEAPDGEAGPVVRRAGAEIAHPEIAGAATTRARRALPALGLLVLLVVLLLPGLFGRAGWRTSGPGPFARLGRGLPAGRPAAVALLLAGAVVAATSCAEDQPTGPGEEPLTYTVALTAVELEGETSGLAGDVSGLPIAGTVLSVGP